jgi:hypothetical protein
MNAATIYRQTAKGTREASAATPALAPRLGMILAAIDGKTSVAVLRARFDRLTAAQLDEALAALAGGDFIRDAVSPEPTIPATGSDVATPEGGLRKAEELRAKIRVLRGGGEPAAPDAAEAEAEKRREAEAASAAAEAARQRAEVQARLLAEEQEWQAAEAQREAAEAARRATAQLTAQVTADVAKPPPPTTSSPSRNWGKPLALCVAALLLIGMALVHLISFDGQIPRFEQALSAQFQQPAKIRAIHLGLLPHVHLRLDDVALGAAGQIRVGRVKAFGRIGNLFDDKKTFTSLELEAPALTAEGLGWILFGQHQTRDMAFRDVKVLGASLESKDIKLPLFDATVVSDGDGGWKAITISAQDQNLVLALTPKGNSVIVEVNAKTFKLPFGSTLTLEEFAAKGTANAGGLTLNEFRGFTHGGTLSGNARLQWVGRWTLAGELNFKQIDTALVVPDLLTGGRLAGTASYAMQASEAATLFAMPYLEGTVAMPWGTLLGVDLGRMLQGGEKRGETKFSELRGNFVHERKATQLRQLRLVQGALVAGGTLDVDADGDVRGSLEADLKLPAAHRHTNLALSGNLGKLEWSRQ